MAGESAFRFDIPTLTLFVLGSRIAMDEFFIVLVSVLFLSFLIIFVTILWGRIWCGWLCPQTVISDITRFADRFGALPSLKKLGVILVIILISCILSAVILWYFVSPYDFIRQFLSGNLGAVAGWSWFILSALTAINFLFIRRRFCATVCPYAKMQGTLYDDQTLIITMDPQRRDECMRCDACVRTCPVDIDIRKGLQAACINCTECIDACADRMGRRHKSSLIRYRYGIKGTAVQFFRKGVLFSLTGTVLFLILLLYLTAVHPQLDFVIMPDSRSAPRRSSDGHLVNVYILALTNRSNTEMNLIVQGSGKSGSFQALPARLRIPAHGYERIILTMRKTDELQAFSDPIPITITLVKESDGMAVAQQNTKMLLPVTMP